MALSDTRIRALKPTEKQFKVADESGLYLLVTPTGSKLWRLKYRFEGKEKTLSFGSYPDTSLAKAREMRDEARKVLADSKDPGAQKKEIKANRAFEVSNSFEAAARAWLARQARDLSEVTTQKNTRLFERDLFPWLGKKPLADITSKELLATLRRIEVRSADTAYRASQLCGQFFRDAVINQLTESDPTYAIKGAIKPPKQQHFASITDPKGVGELLRAIDAFNGTFVVRCALQIAPHVFVRPGELRKAKWSDIDWEAARWNFITSKTSTEHSVPLTKQVILILKELQALTGAGDFIFQVGYDRKKPMSDGTINAALTRMGYDTKTQITGHGFRAMARTMLAERLEMTPEIIEHQLGHAVPDMLKGAYNRTTNMEQRKKMMQEWSDYLDELKAGAKVISLRA